MRAMAPIRLVHLDAMPCFLGLGKQLNQAHPPALALRITQQTPPDEQPDEPMYVGMSGEKRPIEPTDLAILTIGVVITVLRAAHLISHDDHRNAQRKHRYGQKVLHLAVPHGLNGGIGRWSLHA